jgi:AcrR family transcriptional regulator
VDGVAQLGDVGSDLCRVVSEGHLFMIARHIRKTLLSRRKRTCTVMNMIVRTRSSLLDVVAEVLVADPAASLAEVAEAAGIGRTTLHKQYATRGDLIRAVGFRALDLWEQALDGAELVWASGHGVADPDPHGALRALTAAMIPIGPQLAFLWRTPEFDRDEEIKERYLTVEARVRALLQRAQEQGALAADVPGWWLLAAFHALVYVGAESVDTGDLAPREAPDRVLRTFLHGIGAQR